MGKNKKKSFELGFFFRHEFKEQLRRMQTVSQVMEVLDAASDYVMTDNYSIQDAFSDLAFSAWLPCLKHEKETYLQVCEQNKINRQEREKKKAKQQQQPELFKEEAASEGDNVPLVEVEEVEPYPFEFFWREYISHKDEQNARHIWKRLPNDLREKAINGAKIYTQYVLVRKSKDPNFDAILKPSSFLRDAHWNDEYKEEELTPQNYGNNNVQYNNRLVQQQRNNEVLRNIMAEAAAAVRPRNPIETAKG